MRPELLHIQDLNEASAPDEVSQILRNAADSYYEAASELEATWQDPNCGRPWAKIARILEQAADKIDKTIATQHHP